MLVRRQMQSWVVRPRAPEQRGRDLIRSPSTEMVKPRYCRQLWAKHHRKEMEKQQREGIAAWRKIKGLERMAVKKAIRGN